MGRRGAEAKKRYKARAIAAEEAAEEHRQRLLNSALPADRYLVLRVQRTRAQIDRLDALLMKETDPQRLSWLATTVAKLSEVERVLSNRPNPGQYRPSPPRRRSAGMPLLVPE